MTVEQLPPRAFLGAGQMAGALVRGLLPAGLVRTTDPWAASRGPSHAEARRVELGINAARNLEAAATELSQALHE